MTGAGRVWFAVDEGSLSSQPSDLLTGKTLPMALRCYFDVACL